MNVLVIWLSVRKDWCYLGYIYYNPHPYQRLTGDCVIRAITKAMEHEGYTWEQTYSELCVYGMMYHDMPSSNMVWGTFLIDHGFEEYTILKQCKDCYTIKQFCEQHPNGTYVIGTDSHAVAVVNGDVYDVFNSRDMIPTYYFEKIKEEQ